MKTLRITRVFDAAKLHGELEAAGVAVVTVRASSVEMGGPSSYGVVVLGEKADMKKAEGVIKAHKEDRKPSRQPDAKAMEAALRVMEQV
jgi:hypothetical protein